MTIKNESYWSEVEDHTVFNFSETKDEAWRWLEKLQQGRRLNARDILALGALLRLSYQAGVRAAEQDRLPPIGAPCHGD